MSKRRRDNRPNVGRPNDKLPNALQARFYRRAGGEVGARIRLLANDVVQMLKLRLANCRSEKCHLTNCSVTAEMGQLQNSKNWVSLEKL
jgi:hypothetical protein